MRNLAIVFLMAVAIFCSFTNLEGRENKGSSPMITTTEKFEKATFAGGCFWCMEPPFEKLDGVKDVISGYTGGKKENPTYEEVSSGRTGHLESIEVIYDPAKVTYSQLLDVFWRQIDPTDAGGSFVDRGGQYRSAIFYHDEEQHRLAVQSKESLAKSGVFNKPVVTEILKASTFYRAEDYHQDYHKKNPIRYKYYRHNSGRDQFLKKAWGEHPKVEGARQAPGIERRYQKMSKEVLLRTVKSLIVTFPLNSPQQRLQLLVFRQSFP